MTTIGIEEQEPDRDQQEDGYYTLSCVDLQMQHIWQTVDGQLGQPTGIEVQVISFMVLHNSRPITHFNLPYWSTHLVYLETMDSSVMTYGFVGKFGISTCISESSLSLSLSILAISVLHHIFRRTCMTHTLPTLVVSSHVEKISKRQAASTRWCPPSYKLACKPH